MPPWKEKIKRTQKKPIEFGNKLASGTYRGDQNNQIHRLNSKPTKTYDTDIEKQGRNWGETLYVDHAQHIR